jgi:hypothetical protein
VCVVRVVVWCVVCAPQVDVKATGVIFSSLAPRGNTACTYELVTCLLVVFKPLTKLTTLSKSLFSD